MLKGRLVEAAALYAKKTPDFDLEPDAEHWQREGIIRALVAILKFLKPHTNLSNCKKSNRCLPDSNKTNTDLSNRNNSKWQLTKAY